MAFPGELIRVVARATGEDEASVFQHDRNLVTAGLRPKGGRGTSAAKVTPVTSARLLISVLASHRVRDGVAVTQRYDATQSSKAWWHLHYPDDDMGDPHVWADFPFIPELTGLPAEHTFLDALAALIEVAAGGRLIPIIGGLDNLKITLQWPRAHARIDMMAGRIRPPGGTTFSVRADYVSSEPPSERAKHGTPTPNTPQMRRYTETNALPIVYIGALLGGTLDKLPEIESQ